MTDKPPVTIPRSRVKRMESSGGMFSSRYDGPRYLVELVDGSTTYWVGEYAPSEFNAAISSAHRVAKRSQVNRYQAVNAQLDAMLSTLQEVTNDQ